MRTVWYTILVLITLTILAVIWQFGSAVVIFLLSLAFAAAVRPVIDSLKRRGMKKSLAMVISFSLIIVVIAGLVALVSGSLATDFQNIGNDLQREYEWVKNVWLQSENTLLVNFASQLPTSREIYATLTGDASGVALRTVLGVAEGSLSFLAKIFLIMVLSIYWAADQSSFERLWLSILPVKTRTRARNVWQAMELGVGNYIRREGSFSLISGILLWSLYLLLGIKYPALLTVFSMFARLLPWIGPFLVILMPLLFGSIHGLGAAVAAAFFTILILIVIDLSLPKRFFPKQQYSSLLQVFILVALAHSYGLIGAILATILTIALQILLEKLLKQPIGENEKSITQSISSLKSKIELIKENVALLDDINVSESANYLSRLEQLVNKVEVVKRNQ